MLEQDDTDTRSRWGRVRFGSRRASAMAVALPIGATLAIAAGAIIGTTGNAGPHPLIASILIAILLTPPLAGFAWIALVDRDTLRGAARDPEQTVESAWYVRASSDAFTDVLLIVGLGTAAVALTGAEFPTTLALAAVLLVAMGAFGIRYAIQRRRG
ncbi:hypothetical protein [Salinibacterium sp. ZJ70]|uniref:hypothetical protein n=1 Tax=Salinibacterium sp. ZJ70 TaxID=2708084 RepID=UPI00141EEB51|nr:hypothetical protein [Salinibacterium sp. ZJ70]